MPAMPLVVESVLAANGELGRVLSVDEEANARQGGLVPIGPELLPGTRSEAVQEAPLLIPRVTMAELERMAILQALKAVDGSTARAAEMLGISRRKVQYRLKEWGLTGALAEDGEPQSDHPGEGTYP